MNSTLSSSAIATTSVYCDLLCFTPLWHRKTLLIDPELLKLLRLGILCKGKLVSKELKLDALDEPVAKDWKIIELMVGNDRPTIIEQIVISTPEHKGYLVVDRGQVIGALN